MWPALLGAGISALSSFMGGRSQDKASAANAAASESSIWGPQQSYLGDIYSQGQGLYQGQAGNQAQSQQYFAGLQNSAQGSYNQLLQGPQNPYLTGMAQAGMDQVGRQFQNQIMPGLVGGANAAGQLGGERFAQMQAQAAGEAQRAMGDVGNQIYGNAWNSGLQSQLGALGQTGMMGNLGMQSLQAPWMGLQQYAGAIGSPVMGHGTAFGQGGIAGGGGGGYGGAGQYAGGYDPQTGMYGNGSRGNDVGFGGGGYGYDVGFDGQRDVSAQGGFGSFGGVW